MDVTSLTITQASNGLRTKQFSSEELVQAALHKIAEKDKKINAFITVTKDQAIKDAKKADKLLANGDSTKSLLGIPFTLKDVFNTNGIKTTAGSKILENYISPYNASIYQNLLDDGAILIGKTNCDAFGHGSSTENSDYGVTKNPWNTDKVAGGSSGGSAAALAYGAGLFSIAEDTGGSIRQPAAFCGVTGLKPTWGVVSRYGCVAYASSLDTVGPMARTVEDIATIMNTIGQQDNQDASQGFREPPFDKNYDYSQILTSNQKYKIGIPKEYMSSGNNPEIGDAINQARKDLEKLGHTFVEISLPHTEYAIECYYLLAMSETSSNLARYDGIRFGEKREIFNDENKRRIMLGTFALSSGYYDQYYLKALKIRNLIYQDFINAQKNHGVDLLLAPVTPMLPFAVGEKTEDPLAMYLADIYTVSINVAAVPSLALPCGISKNGLPIGMQLIGPHYSEATLLNIGYQYQQATSWHTKKPLISG